MAVQLHPKRLLKEKQGRLKNNQYKKYVAFNHEYYCLYPFDSDPNIPRGMDDLQSNPRERNRYEKLKFPMYNRLAQKYMAVGKGLKILIYEHLFIPTNKSNQF